MPIASVFTGLFIAAAAVLAVILVVWLFLTLNRIRASLENINRLLMHIANEVIRERSRTLQRVLRIRPRNKRSPRRIYFSGDFVRFWRDIPPFTKSYRVLLLSMRSTIFCTLSGR